MSEDFKKRYTVWKKWSKRNTNSWFHKILVLFGVVHSPTFELEMSMERCRESIRKAEAAMKGLTMGIRTDGKKTIGDLGQDIVDSLGVPANAIGGKLPGSVTDDLDDKELDGVIDNFCGTVTDGKTPSIFAGETEDLHPFFEKEFHVKEDTVTDEEDTHGVE